MCESVNLKTIERRKFVSCIGGYPSDVIYVLCSGCVSSNFTTLLKKEAGLIVRFRRKDAFRASSFSFLSCSSTAVRAL